MDVLDRYHQVKQTKKSSTTAECEIVIYDSDDGILITIDLTSDYLRFNKRKCLVINYSLSLDFKKGDIQLYRSMNNYDASTPTDVKGANTNTKNKFFNIEEFVHDGFYRGEKRINYWGVRFNRATERMVGKLENLIKSRMKSEYYLSKDYTNKSTVSPLFDLLVDFHLERKNIKGHDGIYHTIQKDYPPLKYLKSNDYKFLPATLDYYGIKSKYILSEINKLGTRDYSIRALSYVCRLFGDNYIDYIKKIVSWDRILYDGVPNKKYHTLQNETEKKNMVSLINDWESNGLMDNSMVYAINEMLSNREYLTKKGFELKFTAKDDDGFTLLNKNWMSLRDHVKKGYKVRFTFPEEFLHEIEEKIMIEDKEYEVTVLKTEQDFILEGHTMKNCMANQFRTGGIYVYMFMSHKNKRINLQYRKGCLTQCYGKANSTVDTLFNLPIQTLNKKMSKYSDLEWIKEKFDFIS